jgi:hypothetical protein
MFSNRSKIANMKFLPLLLFTLIIASCQNDSVSSEKGKKNTQNQDKTTSENAQTLSESELIIDTLEYSYFAGAIGLFEQEVLLELHCNEKTIEGAYWYLKHGKRIELKGSRSAKSNEWQLTERVKGKTTGHMTLVLKGDSLVGQWYAPEKKSEIQHVSLKRVLDNHAGKYDFTIDRYEREKQITMYDGQEDREETVTDAFRMIRIEDALLFQYHVTGTNGHIGTIDGLAEFVSDNRAIFRGEYNCALTITFTKDQVTVIEDDCSYYRGARAYFDGALQKVN